MLTLYLDLPSTMFTNLAIFLTKAPPHAIYGIIDRHSHAIYMPYMTCMPYESNILPTFIQYTPFLLVKPPFFILGTAVSVSQDELFVDVCSP